MIEGILFDVDGTLVDSNVAHTKSWLRALSENGYNVPEDQIRRSIGKGGDKLLRELTGVAKDSAEGKRLSERRAALFEKEYLPTLKPFPEVPTLLEKLLRNQKKLFIATSASEDDLCNILKVCGLTDFFPVFASAKDAKRSKPDPDILLAAIEKSKLPPASLVMIGDTPYDIQAAKRAGVASIGLTTGFWSAAELSAADETYADPATLMHSLCASLICKG